MTSRWISFFYEYRDLPKDSTAFSTWVGSGLLIVNSIVRFSNFDDGLIELTRPLCEVVCVAGLMMMVMLIVRRYSDTNLIWWAIGLASHALIGLCAWGAAVTPLGILICAVAIFSALLFYWISHALLELDTWPYQMAPLELAALCVSMLAIRLI